MSTASSRALSPHLQLWLFYLIFSSFPTPQLILRSRTTQKTSPNQIKVFYVTISIRLVQHHPNVSLVEGEEIRSARCFSADYTKLTKVGCHSTWLTSISAQYIQFISRRYVVRFIVAHGCETPPCYRIWLRHAYLPTYRCHSSRLCANVASFLHDGCKH